MQFLFSRNRESGEDPTPARVALCLIVMLSAHEQIAAAESTLEYMAENEGRLSADTFKRALDELRLFAQVVDEGDE